MSIQPLAFSLSDVACPSGTMTWPGFLKTSFPVVVPPFPRTTTGYLLATLWVASLAGSVEKVQTQSPPSAGGEGETTLTRSLPLWEKLTGRSQICLAAGAFSGRKSPPGASAGQKQGLFKPFPVCGGGGIPIAKQPTE